MNKFFQKKDLIIQNEWTLRAGNDGFIEEVFDLQGAPLTSITKSWQPWLRVYDCQPGNRNCKTSGLLHEMMDLLAKYIWLNNPTQLLKYKD